MNNSFDTRIETGNISSTCRIPIVFDIIAIFYGCWSMAARRNAGYWGPDARCQMPDAGSEDTLPVQSFEAQSEPSPKK